jgi:hypothetical protein
MAIPEPKVPLYLTAAALEWALDHAERFGDTVFLPAAFEYEAIRYDWDSVREWLMQQDMVKWNPRSGRRFLATKTGFSFRYITQLDPIEYLAFTALLHEVGPQLERIRVPAKDQIVFSWRFVLGPKGQMYDPDYEWLQFTHRCEELAGEARVKYVVLADIADFFPRVYIHPVERVLAEATGSSAHAYCLLRHIRNWNAFVSYGLPVGVSGSRIIAEATITDIDRGLIGARRRYCRYADDIRIFCDDEAEARKALEQLARMLFESHGLTLQPAKTDILTAEKYVDRFDISDERLEAESLTERFHELIEEAGFSDDYNAELDYDDLPEEIREKIDALNLVAVFKEQLDADRTDPIILKILLHRLGQLNIPDIVDDLLANLDLLGHVMDSVVKYLSALRELPEHQRHDIGRSIIAALDSASSGQYERFCLLSLFTRDREYDQGNQFEALLYRFEDAPTRREVILSLGRAQQEHWFIANRRDVGQLEPWSRRAFLAAFSCVADDARRPFYRSLRGGVDVLESAVIRWAQDHPFS